MQSVESRLTDIIAGLSPWLAPIPTAFLVGRATAEHLAWPVPVAICAALIVESLGLAATNTALTLREYNARRRKTDPRAPFSLAAALVGGYIAIAILLTVALDVLPGLARYAPAIFPALSLAGVTVLALRADHARRLEAIAQERQERKAERQERKLAGNLPRAGSTARKVSGKDWRQLPAEDRALIATMPAGAIQAAYGVSERTARNWRAAARNNGNGHHAQAGEP